MRLTEESQAMARLYVVVKVNLIITKAADDPCEHGVIAATPQSEHPKLEFIRHCRQE